MGKPRERRRRVEEAAADSDDASLQSGDQAPRSRPSASALFTLGTLGLLLVLYAVDFYRDCGQRDAFSWMDPYQYYLFALNIASGKAGVTDISLPSIFPLFVLPFVHLLPSVSGALWVNVAFVAVLIAALVALCRQVGVGSPPVLVAAVLLSSPILIGLSRELYVELTLTALVAVQFAVWFASDQLRRPLWVACFCALLTVGLMTKMTYPLFFVLPFLFDAYRRLRSGSGRWRRLLVLVSVFAGSFGVALLSAWWFFPKAFGYYLSLGNTVIPTMRLIGPPERFSLDSISFYFLHVGKSMLLLLAPFLVLALVRARSLGVATAQDGASRRSLVWLWLVGPLVLLVLQTTKEPRHVAPCVVPAVLLMFLAVEAIPRKSWRQAALAGMVLAAVGNYLLVTSGAFQAPYFMDRALGLKSIEHDLMRVEGTLVHGRMERVSWLHGRSIAITGFPPNEALAVAWHFRPGLTVDLDLFSIPRRRFAEVALESYQDLYTLSAFNVYNWRCRWSGFYETLERDVVVDNADFLLIRGDGDRAAEFPGFMVVGESMPPGGARTVLLASRNEDRRALRLLFSDRYLRSGRAHSTSDLDAVHFDRFLVSLSVRQLVAPRASLDGFPTDFRPSGRIAEGSIYHYTETVALARARAPGYISYLRKLYGQ